MHTTPEPKGEINGADFFIESLDQPMTIGKHIESLLSEQYKLSTISNRGTQVYPIGSIYTECIDQYRVRIENKGNTNLTQKDILALTEFMMSHYKLCSMEMLMKYDGKEAYSLAQGQ